MPRSKTGNKRDPVCGENLKAAIKAVTSADNKISLREACKVYQVKIGTLHRHMKAFRESGREEYVYEVKYDVKKVFNEEEENSLVNYIKSVARMQYGLSKKGVRELAYKFALHNNNKIPEKWKELKIAGEEWMRLFLKRHQDLSLRKPEAISLSRSTSFNRANVDKFFRNLNDVHTRFGPIPPERIYNLDETGPTTVQQPKRILAPKGEKQVGSITSAERGSLVTMVAAINALGNQIPPLFIFPRVNYKEFMLRGAPPVSIGGANSSGWTNERLFIQFLNHFIHHTKPSPQERILLILDNHETHMSIEAIDLCRKSGIILLTFPPHTSHRLQPLDLTVFGPFKAFYNEEVDIWHRNNPGKTFDIYCVAEVAGKVYNRAFSTSNITSGFAASGIYPLNPNVFADTAFLMSYVTDRPLESSVNLSSTKVVNQPSTSSFEDSAGTSTAGNPSTPAKQNNPINTFVSPEEIQPLPKSAPRKTTNKERKAGRTRILTDTPEKNEIMMQKQTKNHDPIQKSKLRKVTRKVMESSDSESEENVLPDQFDESDDEETLTSLIEKEIAEEEDQRNFESEELEVGDFVLIQFLKKKAPAEHFVGEICGKDNKTDLSIKFLKRVSLTNKFWYESQTIFAVPVSDVVLKLPRPKRSGGSKRLDEQFLFEIEFSYKYNVK